VGKNTALGIVYWLKAAGLAEKGSPRNREPMSEELGQLINEEIAAHSTYPITVQERWKKFGFLQ